MPQISFPLILTENLRNKNLKVKQVESVIEVTGSLDPYQIQKIRDHVSDSFQARRKTINDFIKTKAEEAEEAQNAKQRKDIMREVNTTIGKSFKAFDKKIQDSVTVFCEKDAELQQAAKTGRWSYLVNTAWDVGAILWNGTEAVGGTAAAVATGGTTAALALKGLFDLCMDLEKLWRTQADAWRGLDAQETRLADALDAIKKVKKGSLVPQSAIDKAETTLAPLGPKIDVVEKNTRAVAAKVDLMLKDQALKKLKDKKAIAELEKTIQELVEGIAKQGAYIAAKRKAQSKAKDSIRTAMTKAKADPWSYVTWARGIYEDINDHIDMATPAEGLYDAVKKMKLHIEKLMEADDD